MIFEDFPQTTNGYLAEIVKALVRLFINCRTVYRSEDGTSKWVCTFDLLKSAIDVGFAGYHYSGAISNCYYSDENSVGIGVISAGKENTTAVYGKSITELQSYNLLSGTDSGNGLSWTDSATSYNTGNL